MQFANISNNFDFAIYGVYNVNLTSKCYEPKQLTRQINPKPCNLEDLTLEKFTRPGKNRPALRTPAYKL